MYIQVNIGRNFVPNRFNDSGGILSEVDWYEFQDGVASILERYRVDSGSNYEIPELHLGTGVWNGKIEESAKISLYHEGGFDLDGIREQLFRLKKEYSQGTIALLIGSELI